MHIYIFILFLDIVLKKGMHHARIHFQYWLVTNTWLDPVGDQHDVSPWIFSPLKQGLVNVPWLGDFEHHLKKYLLEIISPIFGWCEKLGHLPSPVKTGHRWQEWANQMDIFHRIIHSNSLGAVITQSPLTGDILEYAENPTLANHAEAREHIH